MNATNTEDVRTDLISMMTNHMELLINRTNLEGVLDSISRILSYISNHRDLMINDTHIDDVETSFELILSFWSNHRETLTVCALYLMVTDIVIGIICGLGIIANIVAFNIFGKMGNRNSSTMLLRALAAMDSLLMLLAILNRPYRIGYYVFSLIYFRPVFLASQIAAVWTHVLLGINRYLVVCRPLMASRLCTLNMARKQFAAVLLFALVYALPQFFEIETIIWKPTDKDGPVFSIIFRSWAESSYYQIIYQYTLWMIFLFVAPFILQLLLSIRLGTTLYRARKERREMGGNISDTDKYVTRLVLGVLIVFLICYIPVAVNGVLWIVHGENLTNCGDIVYYFQPIALIFIVLNSSINCLIFGIFNPTFRKTLKTFLPFEMCERIITEITSVTDV